VDPVPEESLGLHAKYLAAVVDSSDDAIISKDLNGTILSWNRSAERIFGYTASEMIGQSIRRIIPTDRQSEEDEVVARLSRGEKIDHFETVRQHKDGTLIPISLTVSPIRNDAGIIVGASKIARDIGDRKRLAAIVESSDDAIISKTLQGIITSWNPASERMFGYSAEEMIGQSIRRIIPADRQFEEDDVVSHIRRGQKVDHFETVRQHKDGHLVPISLTVSPIHDERGFVIGASKIARDISERKDAEAERGRLLALAQLNAAITNTLNDVGAVVASALDREQVVQKVTDAATQLTGARFGAFFYNLVDARGESYTLYTISGVPRDAFANFPMPRNTEVFNPTFRGSEVVRSDDITADPRYGQNPPHYGMPTGHLPVRSYLAVPVKTRSGEPLGGLFFGHPEVARFTAEHERVVSGIASWASVALENARLYRAAQDANSLKDEFLATLSHELRTPLNAILGYARMLRSGILTSNKWPRAVDIIERNAAALSRIVEDVLDISRIVSGKMRLSLTAVDLAKLVRDAIDSVQPGATAKGIDIDSTLDEGTGSVPGDAERLQQVVWNILSNAVKFTERGGRITVTLARHGGNVQLMVSDTGIGMAPEFLPHIFERFRQADAGTTRERGGLGLGLSIARQLVEMHGGTIVASSGGRGAGSAFTMTLPITAPAEAAADDGRRPTHPHAERAVIPDLRGTSVLVVDDDEDALTMVRDILEASGASVVTARSANDALRALAQSPPDVLIADLGMPEMDGFELIQKVRAHTDPKVSQVPAAALTAFARSEDRARALQNGFDRHLAKPIDPEALMAAVAQLRGKGRLARIL
jgi:PAS domain S-box-containing protein